MEIINIRKDGTIVDDMSKVTVPKEIVESALKILQKKGCETNEKICSKSK